jgi:hypothetical protein
MTTLLVILLISAWYVSGFISCLYFFYKEDKCITVGNLFLSMFLGIFGLIEVFTVFFYYNWNKKIYEKK